MKQILQEHKLDNKQEMETLTCNNHIYTVTVDPLLKTFFFFLITHQILNITPNQTHQKYLV